MDEQLAFYGGAVKALGGGKVGGYLVLFSGPSDPDLEGDYFTKETELFIDSGDQRPILYRHGVHPLIKSQRIGKATLTIDDTGVFVDGEVDLRNKYIAALYRKAEEKKDEPFLGWSSGASTHLVKKKSVGKAQEITEWAISEASLTPCPVEPRTSAFPLKSLAVEDDLDLDAVVKSYEVQEEAAVLSLQDLPALKALCEAVSPANLTMSEHSNVADAALKELLSHGSIFVDAFKGFRVRADRLVEFRFKKDGTHISAAKEASLKTWKQGLGQLRMSIESVEHDIEGTLKLSEISRSQVDAADKHAKFLMQQLANLQGIIAKE